MRFCFLVLALNSAAVAVGDEHKFKWADIQQLVQQHFSAKQNYVPGDLITRADAQPILNQLNEHGFHVDRIANGMDPFVPDNHALVQWLKSPQGEPLMRKLSNVPQAFDWVDRLSWFPAGQKLLQKAANDHEPLKALETLVSDTTTAELGKTFELEALTVNIITRSLTIYPQAKLL